MIEPGIYMQLATNSALQALVGARIFAGVAPDDAALYPCISYSLRGGSAEATMETSGMIHQRVEFNGFAMQPVGSSTPETIAAQIRAAIIAALNGWQELLSDGTCVSDAELINPGTDFVSEQRIFRAMCEFRIHYTLPTA